MKRGTIAVLGVGTMGRTIVEGLIRSGRPRRTVLGTARTRVAAQRLERELGIEVGTGNAAAAQRADIVVLALKPKRTLEIAAELAAAGALRPGALVISIAAGVALERLEALFDKRRAVVRAMPNTPCAIGCGTTVLSAGTRAGEIQMRSARGIFETLGRVIELEERHMDTVTGLSASGPAFVYVILEALADGGVARGLPRDVALEMAAQMVLGAASMVLETGRHPASLKDDVTTPAGCTIAGILALEDGKIRSVLSRAVEIASRRAGELASS